NALTMQGINRAYAPTGQGGAAIQAGMDAQTKNLNDWLNMYRGVGQQEQDVAGALARGGYQYGSDLANTNAGFAQALANLKVGQGNALAGSRFAQSALGQGGLGNLIKGFTPGASGQSPFGSMLGGVNNLLGNFGGSSSFMGPGGWDTTVTSAGSGLLGGIG